MTRFRTIPGDELLHCELVVSPGMRGTQTVQDSGFRMIQIRQPQNDLAMGWFSASLAHARGLHAAEMHKLEQSYVNVGGHCAHR